MLLCFSVPHEYTVNELIAWVLISPDQMVFGLPLWHNVALCYALIAFKTHTRTVEVECRPHSQNCSKNRCDDFIPNLLILTDKSTVHDTDKIKRAW